MSVHLTKIADHAMHTMPATSAKYAGNSRARDFFWVKTPACVTTIVLDSPAAVSHTPSASTGADLAPSPISPIAATFPGY